jgi:hypothetical protein
MSEEMQLELEHTLKTMRELKEAKAEITRLLGVISTLRGELRNAGCSCCRHWFDRSDMEASDDQA